MNSYNKFLKIKMKAGKNAAEFHDEDEPEIGFTYICLPVISA